MSNTPKFTSEAELVAVYLGIVEKQNTEAREGDGRWIVYPETCGFDLLLVHDLTGIQVALEAKLSINVKVLCQALSGMDSWRDKGPDYRAVLVPGREIQNGVEWLAGRLGVTILSPYNMGYGAKPRWECRPDLPTERAEKYHVQDRWFPWCPAERMALPEYVPDVEAGKPSPMALTPWKIAAIKLSVLLDKRGYITRADMKALHLNSSYFCGPNWRLHPAHRQGRFQCYTAGPYWPDFRAQHPKNYAEIETDFPTWGADFDIEPTTDLLGDPA